MAGLGRKVFSAGEVLTAANVQGYLADQSVMRFASSAARATAIGTATEGMISYLDDVNQVEQFDGSSWSGLVTTANVGSLAPQGNAIINGGFDINQRGFTSTTASATFMFDRFNSINTDGTVTWSAQTFTPGTAPVSGYEAKNYLRVATTGQTLANARTILQHNVESVRNFAGQTVTVSFFAKATAGTPKIAIELQRFYGDGGSPSATEVFYAGQVTTSTSWVRYSVTYAVPSIVGKTLGTANDGRLTPLLWTSAGSDYNARTGSLGIQNSTIDIWGVQLEAGSVATPFRRNAPSLQAELAACQRYYQKSYVNTATVPTNSSFGNVVFSPGLSAVSNTFRHSHVRFPVVMRSAPTVTTYSFTNSTTSVVSNGAGTDLAASSAIADFIGDVGFSVINSSGGSITPANGGFIFHYKAEAEL